MTNKSKAEAAILDLINDLKSEGVETLNEKNIKKHKLESPKIDEKEKSNKSYYLDRIPTKLITPWKLANRIYFNPASLAELENSIRLQGQQIPAIVRKAGSAFELICGARRLQACKNLGIDLLTAVIDTDDKSAALIMDIENREREDISAYERSRDYKRWLEEGVYSKQAEIAEALGMSKSVLSQYLTIADLDRKLVESFEDPNKISIKWGYELKKFLDTKPELLNKAIHIAKQGSDVKKVLAILKSKPTTNKVYSLMHKNGETVGEYQETKAGTRVLKLSKKISQETIEKILSLLEAKKFDRSNS